MIIIYNDHVWWSCMMIIYDDHLWWWYMMIIYDNHIWWNCWWSYMMIMYDDHISWSCMMKMLMNKLFFHSFISNMLGDLWDVFRHHHWCLGHYVEPLSTNTFSGKTFLQEEEVFEWHFNLIRSFKRPIWSRFTCPFPFFVFLFSYLFYSAY